MDMGTIAIEVVQALFCSRIFSQRRRLSVGERGGKKKFQNFQKMGLNDMTAVCAFARPSRDSEGYI